MPADIDNQCAAVNFVTGSNETLGDACSNKTEGFKAEWSNSLASEDDGHSGHSDHSDHSDSESATPSGESAAAETTSAEGSGAIATAGLGAFVGGMGALAAALML